MDRSLSARCSDDAFVATVSYDGSHATIKVRDAVGSLVARLMYKSVSSPLAIGWNNGGQKLVCVFRDGKFIQYCKPRREQKVARFEVVGKHLTACVIKPSGLVALLEGSQILLVNTSSKNYECWRLDVSMIIPDITQLHVSASYDAICYASSANKLCLFKFSRVFQRSISQILNVAVAPSGRAVSILTEDRTLKIISPDLQQDLYTLELPGLGGVWTVHWYTSSFLFVTCSPPNNAVIILQLGEDGDIRAHNISEEVFTNDAASEMSPWRCGVYALVKSSLQNEASQHYRYMHSCQLLRSSVEFRLVGYSGIPASSAGNFVMSIVSDHTQRTDNLCSFHSQCDEERYNSSRILLQSKKPYTGYKLCPDALKGRYFTSYFDKVLVHRSSVDDDTKSDLLVEKVDYHAKSYSADSLVFLTEVRVDAEANMCKNTRRSAQTTTTTTTTTTSSSSSTTATTVAAAAHVSTEWFENRDSKYGENKAKISTIPVSWKAFYRFTRTSEKHYDKYVNGVRAVQYEDKHRIQCYLISPREEETLLKIKCCGQHNLISTRLRLLDEYGQILSFKKFSPARHIFSSTPGNLRAHGRHKDLHFFDISHRAMEYVLLDEAAKEHGSLSLVSSNASCAAYIDELADAYKLCDDLSHAM